MSKTWLEELTFTRAAGFSSLDYSGGRREWGGQSMMGQDGEGPGGILLGTGVRRYCSVIQSFCQVAKIQAYSSE